MDSPQRIFIVRQGLLLAFSLHISFSLETYDGTNSPIEMAGMKLAESKLEAKVVNMSMRFSYSQFPGNGLPTSDQVGHLPCVFCSETVGRIFSARH